MPTEGALIAVVEAGTRTRLDRKEFSQRLIEWTGVLKHREVAYAPAASSFMSGGNRALAQPAA